MKKDLYAILGVAHDASEEDIKKAYRKLAKTYHPDAAQVDKDLAEKKFKEISSAYETLGNPEKRRRYDFRDSMFGFGSFFEGGFNPFVDSDNFTSQRVSGPRGSDIRISISLTLEDVARGCEREIKYKADRECRECNATGSRNKNRETCGTCRGSGVVMVQTGPAHGFLSVAHSAHCPKCSGRGYVSSDPCPACGGRCYLQENQAILVNIPAGIHHNDILKSSNNGNHAPGGAGSLVIIPRIMDHDRFVRKNNDIIEQIDVPLMLAMRGGTFESRDILGRTVTFSVPRACPYGHEVALPSKGIEGGDMRIVITYKLPILEDASLNELSKFL